MAEAETVSTLSTVSGDEFEVSSNVESADDIKKNFAAEKTDETREAAAKLGKAGGEASAKARAEKAEEKEPAKPEAKPEEDKPGNPRHDARARVMQATREAAEAKREAAALKAELEKLRTAPAKPEAEAKPARDPNAKPTSDQFDTYEEYVEAVADWKTEQKLAKAEEARQQREHAERYAAAVTQHMGNFRQKIGKDQETLLSQADPDLLEAKPTFMLPPGTPPGPENAIADEIMSSEHPTELILYLSEHQEDVNRLLGLPSSYAIARAIGAIEAKLPLNGNGAEKPEVKPEKKAEAPVSKAAPPVKPVTGSAQVSGDEELDPEEVDFDRWVSVQNARDARARRGR